MIVPHPLVIAAAERLLRLGTFPGTFAAAARQVSDKTQEQKGV